MRGNGLRGCLWSFAAVFLVVAAGWLLFVSWRRNDLIVYGSFAIPLVLAAGSGAGWAWRRAGARPAASLPGSGLEHGADRLAIAVQAQWEAAAAARGLTAPDPVEVMW